VATVAVMAAALPIGFAWLAGRGLVAPGETNGGATFLVTALFEAPVVLVLGAMAGRLVTRRSAELARSPALGALGALGTLAGLTGAAYLHAVFRAGLADAPGLPPISLVFRFPDFARIAPLLLVTTLVGAWVGAAVGRRRLTLGILSGVGVGLAVGLASGVAVLIAAVPTRLLGPAALYAELALALGAVWLLARRASTPAS